MRLLITADPEIEVPPRLYGGIERIVDVLVRRLRAKCRLDLSGRCRLCVAGPALTVEGRHAVEQHDPVEGQA